MINCRIELVVLQYDNQLKELLLRDASLPWVLFDCLKYALVLLLTIEVTDELDKDLQLFVGWYSDRYQ